MTEEPITVERVMKAIEELDAILERNKLVLICHPDDKTVVMAAVEYARRAVFFARRVEVIESPYVDKGVVSIMRTDGTYDVARLDKD